MIEYNSQPLEYALPLGYVLQRIGRICNPSPQRQEKSSNAS
jgi:hypothetical protein